MFAVCNGSSSSAKPSGFSVLLKIAKSHSVGSKILPDDNRFHSTAVELFGKCRVASALSIVKRGNFFLFKLIV